MNARPDMYAVTEQTGVTEDTRRFAEFNASGCPVVHYSRTRAEARVRPVAEAMGMPPDREPSIWGNISVHVVGRLPYNVAIED